MRKVVSQLKMQDRELVCKDRSGKYRPVFKKQGSLDGACATYSVIMDLLILGAIYEADTHIYAEHKNRTTRKLFKVFCNDYGMHREGQTFFKITRMLNESFSNVIYPEHRLTKDWASVECIVESIQNDTPVIISVQNSSFAHAMLAIGYESENGVPNKILCLDPDGDYIHRKKRWNAEIVLCEGKKTTTYRSSNEGLPYECKVQLDDIIIITKN